LEAELLSLADPGGNPAMPPPPTEAKSHLFHVRGNAVCRRQLSPNHLVTRALPRTVLGQLTVLPRSRLVGRAYRPPHQNPNPSGSWTVAP